MISWCRCSGSFVTVRLNKNRHSNAPVRGFSCFVCCSSYQLKGVQKIMFSVHGVSFFDSGTFMLASVSAGLLPTRFVSFYFHHVPSPFMDAARRLWNAALSGPIILKFRDLWSFWQLQCRKDVKLAFQRWQKHMSCKKTWQSVSKRLKMFGNSKSHRFFFNVSLWFLYGFLQLFYLPIFLYISTTFSMVSFYGFLSAFVFYIFSAQVTLDWFRGSDTHCEGITRSPLMWLWVNIKQQSWGIVAPNNG